MTPVSPERMALVTGARRGLGRAIAEHLLSAGYHVVGCARGEADWEADHFTYRRADVTSEREVRTLLRTVEGLPGRLVASVNNAATASMNHALLTPASSVRDMLATSVRGTFLVSRESAKLMRKQGTRDGRIVNVSSVAVPLRLEGQAAYVAAKGAVERLTQVLARELGELGITVNVIGATPILTDMTRGVPEKTMERLVESLAIKRLGTVADVTNLLDFFLDPASEAVTSQVIYLGGVPNG